MIRPCLTECEELWGYSLPWRGWGVEAANHLLESSWPSIGGGGCLSVLILQKSNRGTESLSHISNAAQLSGEVGIQSEDETWEPEFLNFFGGV